MSRDRIRGFKPSWTPRAERLELKYGESVTDISKWIPGSDSPHTNNGSQFSPLYDFPDGKDTGIDLSYTRQPGLDITEVDAIAKSLSSDVMNKVKELAETSVNETKEPNV